MKVFYPTTYRGNVIHIPSHIFQWIKFPLSFLLRFKRNLFRKIFLLLLFGVALKTIMECIDIFYDDDFDDTEVPNGTTPKPPKFEKLIWQERAVTAPPASPDKPRKIKRILMWNDHFLKNDFGVGSGDEHFHKHHCPVKECELIMRYKNTYPMSEIDALIYHPISLRRALPDVRFPNTRYVYFFLESPATLCSEYDCNAKKYNGVFNYTMTYRRDSDIYISNGGFAIPENITYDENEMIKRVKKKRKLVAWMASNCRANSKRERIVQELQKHVTVDVYGHCGPLKCPKKEKKSCLKKLGREYKFYLSFENSICKDYVTEKFYNVANHHTVPIVYGGGDYEKMSPPNSYINIRDFPNVSELAKYLQYLDSNDTAYMEYFEWKKTYKTVSAYARAWCDLCAKLHSDTEPKVYKDFYGWFQKDVCHHPDDFLAEFLK